MAAETHGAGAKVLVFHGTPGSRLDARFWSAAALANDRQARFTAFDRPGYGSVEPEPGRTLRSVARHAAGLVDTDDVRLLGLSGGAPFALATAEVLGAKVERVVIVSGFGPPEHGLGALQPTADMDRAALTRWAEELAASIPAPPTGIELIDLFAVSTAEGVRDPAGVVDDVLTLRTPWTTDLSSITAEVTLFHARDDDRCPIEGARFLSRTLPRAKLVEWGDGGHLAMALHLPDVLNGLLAG